MTPLMGAGAAIFLLCFLLIIRIPMLISVTAAVFLNIYFSGAWALSLPQTMMSGLGRFVLIALPLFVLAGGLMNSGGISGRLFDFARAIVGSLRGGLAHVNVVTSMFFGGMIGSSTADLAGTGSIVIPAMKDAKYPADFSAALTASSRDSLALTKSGSLEIAVFKYEIASSNRPDSLSITARLKLLWA